MKVRDLAELAGRNLREALLRNVLTTLGIAVGVASLVAMLSLGVGLQELASKRLSRSGLFDAVFVTPRQEFRGFGQPARKANPNPEPRRPLNEDARLEIGRLAHVLEVYPQIRFAAEMRYADGAHVTTVAGLPPSARDSDAFDGMQGAFFSSPAADEAILQIEFARELGAEPAALLGREIVLRYAERQSLPPAVSGTAPADTNSGAAGTNDNTGAGWGFSVVPREKPLRIIGIVETEPGAGPGGFGRGRVFIPMQLAQSLRTVQVGDLREAMRSTSAAANYSSLVVRVDSASRVPAVQDAIKQMGFSTFSLHDATRNLRRFFVILDLFLGIFGSLALAVASLGIINTLVMAILERRREIGILKALGAGDRDIRQLFFAEAGAMGFLGGALGVALGWAIGRLINFGTNVYLRRQDLPSEDIWSVPWWLVVGGMGFAVLVSLAAGIYPAARAAKLDPVQALRYE